MNSIIIQLVDASGLNEFPERMKIDMICVPRVGDTINLHEVIPAIDHYDKGWWFVVDEVEWSCGEGSKFFEPILKLYRKKNS
jgi:hypothetical protein